MYPLSTWVAPISIIAPNETNACYCSIDPFKDYFIIKKQPENGNLLKYWRSYFSYLLNRGIPQLVVRTLTSGARGPRFDLRRW